VQKWLFGDKMYFRGHVAAITGSASGIGLAIAENLIKKRIAGLAICDFDEESLLAAKTKLQGLAESCTEVSVHLVDVTKLEDLERFREEVESFHGKCSILVNNAGITVVGGFSNQEKKDFDRVMRINFDAVVDGTRIFLPMLKREKCSHLVNICSMYGYFVGSGTSSYHASKFAVKGFTEALMLEMAEESPQVKVHCVHPGFIKTNLMKHGKVTNPMMTQKDAEAAFDFVGLTTAEQTAAMIVKGVQLHSARIFIGPDARLLRVLVSLFPTTYLTHKYFRNFALGLVAFNALLAAKLRDVFFVGDRVAILLSLLLQYALVQKLRGRL